MAESLAAKRAKVRAAAARIRSHPLKAFFMWRKISQFELAKMTGFSQTSINRGLARLTPMNPKLEAKLFEIAREHGWEGNGMEQAEKAADKCQICGKNETRVGRKVCDECLGISRAVPPPGGGAEPSAKRLNTCRECGESFEPYMLGRSEIKRLCYGCMIAKRRKSLRRPGGQEAQSARNTRKQPPKKHPTVPSETQDSRISVDFAEYPSVLEWIKKAAHGQVRTPEQQIIYLLIESMKEIPVDNTKQV